MLMPFPKAQLSEMGTIQKSEGKIGEIEAPGISSRSPGASGFLVNFCAVFCFLFRRFPPIRSPFYVKLSWD
jgi:hypothetical protein